MALENPRVKPLLTLGEIDPFSSWPDYVARYGLTQADTDDLIALFNDREMREAPDDSEEIWAPQHAWRCLGQLKSLEALPSLTANLDWLCEDDCALTEIPKVFGMMGEPALDHLLAFVQQPGHEEFAYVMAVDAMTAVVKQDPPTRERVINYARDYLRDPDETMPTLNGLFVANLLELEATELIEDIRQLFDRRCVDLTVAGDIETVEMELGLRNERSTPPPNYRRLHSDPTGQGPAKPTGGDRDDWLNYYLHRYGGQDSIQSMSELDGFFFALGCAPNTIMPSRWTHAIWGGEAASPEWESLEEVEDFNRHLFDHYNEVMNGLHRQHISPLFLALGTAPENEIVIADDWCRGFMRGMALWEKLSPEDLDNVAVYTKAIRYFAEGPREDPMETQAEVRELIPPSVQMLYNYFLMDRTPGSTTPMARSQPKVGRNEPCPCGSGKKYKKCCLIN